jgi:hypothetical protein
VEIYVHVFLTSSLDGGFPECWEQDHFRFEDISITFLTVPLHTHTTGGMEEVGFGKLLSGRKVNLAKLLKPIQAVTRYSVKNLSCS